MACEDEELHFTGRINSHHHHLAHVLFFRQPTDKVQLFRPVLRDIPQVGVGVVHSVFQLPERAVVVVQANRVSDFHANV